MMLFSGRTASGTALSARSSSSTPSSSSSAQQQRKLTEIIQSAAENQACADCGARLSDSIWASTTVGAFLCIHCAGCHRKLGVQLSRVKSVHLDAWTDDEVAAMKAGNKRVHEVYGRFADKWAHVDAAFSLQPATDIATREQCIRAKYEQLQFTKLPITVLSVPSQQRSTEAKSQQDSPESLEDPSASTATMSSPARPNQEHSPVQRPADSTVGNQDAAKSARVVEVSKRLLNYFVVLGRGAPVPNQSSASLASSSSLWCNMRWLVVQS